MVLNKGNISRVISEHKEGRIFYKTKQGTRTFTIKGIDSRTVKLWCRDLKELECWSVARFIAEFNAGRIQRSFYLR